MASASSTRLERVLEGLEHFGVKLGLDRIRRVLAELESPEVGLPVVLVAGTNGKGSVSSWIASIATAAGYRSGLFTSPHLERVEERLRIDGRAVATERLEALVDRVIAASRRADGDVVTYFEAMTTAALCWFRDEGVDLAVMEVGLGGRLDATNVTHPLLSVITPIAFDHQRQLGSSLAEIATEKAGILRPGRPVLASAGGREVERVLASVADELDCPLELIDGKDSLLERQELSIGGQRVTLRTADHTYRLEPRLSGLHQVDNLALAVASAERLAEAEFSAIDRRAVERGVRACRWPGRLEWIRLPDGRTVLLDAAHNPAGLTALLAYLRTVERPFSLVFGMLREKVDPRVVADLWSTAETVVVTQPRSERALAPETLVELVGVETVAIVSEPRQACEAALAQTELVVVCGSLYLVGELRSWLRGEYGVPPSTEQLFD